MFSGTSLAKKKNSQYFLILNSSMWINEKEKTAKTVNVE
jgi:hypothetical protein